jgi:hypothetical protein
MAQNIFKVRRAFLIPLTAVIVLLFLLLVVSLFRGQMWERIVLTGFFISSLFIGIETARREIVVTEEGLQLKKFFRIKNFFWREITHLGVVELRHKAYFLLTTTKGFYFFSNILRNHSLLVRLLVDKLGEEKVEIEVKKYLDHPVERLSLIVMSWIAVLIIIAVIILKFSPA